MTDDTERHAIGANSPPKTVFERIDDLYGEAKLWLDGEAIETDAQAEGLGKLMEMLKAAGDECEAERAAKVKPLNEAKTAIQAVYNPYISEKTGKVAMALGAAKKARDKWLTAKQAVLDEQARVAREEADRMRRAALDAMQSSRGDLAAREEAEALVKRAASAEIAAKVAAKATPVAIGGRKTVTKKFEPVLVDISVAAGHYYKTQRNRMADLLCQLAAEDVRAGKREIPGFVIEKVESVI